MASVLACGVTGQQQQGSIVSADEIVRGGAGGGVCFLGGGTNPGSSEPSPEAKAVPMHNVATKAGIQNPIFFDVSDFINKSSIPKFHRYVVTSRKKVNIYILSAGERSPTSSDI